MVNEKIIINVSGKSCTGKSTLVSELSNRIDEIYTISYDKMKRQLAGYHRDHHKSLVKDLTFGFFEVVCRQGLSIFIDGFISSEEEYNKYLTVGKKHGYKFISVNLEASLDDLLPRFRKRIESCELKNIKISVVDENLFLENQKINYFVPPNSKTFNTAKLNKDEVADQVMNLLS
jgi:predicted kinase